MARTIETNITEEDSRIEGSLRPQCLADYIGQEKVKQNLKVYIEAAKKRGDALDHVLFLWSARIRKDHTGRYYRQRNGHPYEGDQRSGD